MHNPGPTSPQEESKDAAALKEQMRALLALYNDGRFQDVVTRGEALANQFPEVPFIRNLLGAAHDGLGCLEQAATCFRIAVELTPDSAEAHINLGVVLHDLGRYAEAQLSFQTALQIAPGDANAHAKLGNTLHRLGKYNDAIGSYGAALSLQPGNAEALTNLGIVLHGLERYADAEASYRRALHFAPDSADAHNNLGLVQSRLGKHEQALACYQQALQVRPDFVEAEINRADVLRELGRQDEAVAGYQRALQIDSGQVELLNNLGIALAALGRADEAVEHYQQALRLEPDHAKARNNLGIALNDLGRTAEAVLNYEKALQLEPDRAEWHRNLSTAKHYQADDPHLEQMRALLGRPALPAPDRMRLCFALGKACDDAGLHDEAIEYLLQANRLRKAELRYDIASDQAMFARIRARFSVSVARLDETAALPRAASKPIFIVGMPRSGSTLVEQILASHSEVYGAGELALLGQLMNASDWQSAQLSDDYFRSLRRSYLSGLASTGAVEPYITDKMPHNFLWIGCIVAALPEARIIHVRRDARAVCWSNFKHGFLEKGYGYSCDLRDVAEYFKLYAELMAFWHQQFPGRIYDLQYETLTENQADETRRLLEHAGLAWQDPCLEFHRAARTIRTASAQQVRQTMYQGSSNAWRKYAEHLEPMVELLQGL
jgi:tetratricopeptide (TPR) repeat protein